MRSLIGDYYTDDSSDNLSDHVPLFIKLNCVIETVPNEPASVLQSKPVWGLAKQHHVNNYKVKLNEMLYKFLPTDEMLLDHESLCLKQEFITEFHDNIITASHLFIYLFYLFIQHFYSALFINKYALMRYA